LKPIMHCVCKIKGDENKPNWVLPHKPSSFQMYTNSLINLKQYVSFLRLHIHPHMIITQLLFFIFGNFASCFHSLNMST
jgi:hypothetical protein